MSDTCVPYHDWFTTALTSALCIGLVVSYLPQHYRIINNKSSEGLSPWFLLLGSTGCASGMFNMLTLQWDEVKCCTVLSTHACIEMTAGIFQLWLMWFLFTIILVLYMIYYPPHLKYVSVPTSLSSTEDGHPASPFKYQKTENWKLSIILAWIVFIHLLILTLVTFSLLLTTPQSAPSPPSLQAAFTQGTDAELHEWATFLGISSATLAALQYAPQLYHTYYAKLVGALSIPMMCMQTPGTVFMVLSIALRPGTNWTSWIMFAVSGVMQGTLLAMCIAWKLRQRNLGIDDFGRPLMSEDVTHPGEVGDMVVVAPTEDDGAVVTVTEDAMEDTPLLSKGRKRRWWRDRIF